jgi:hypothetical protein
VMATACRGQPPPKKNEHVFSKHSYVKVLKIFLKKCFVFCFSKSILLFVLKKLLLAESY